MICAWKELLSILPPWLKNELLPYEQTALQEIRIRIGNPPELIVSGKSHWLSRSADQEDLCFLVNTASRYSPWASATVAQGYLTAPGGHRIGLCGDAVIKSGSFAGFRSIQSVCIRIARDLSGIAGNCAITGKSILILGAPGWGKTTLLREIARKIAQSNTVCVVDERLELFPDGFPRGRRMDVLSGCPKSQGIEIALRTMGPECIAVDEITSESDCQALAQAAFCGITLLATAHAGGMMDYRHRSIYETLRKTNLFDLFFILHADKTFHTEGNG